MRSTEDMRKARRLLSDGFSSGEVGRELGVPANTVGRWGRGETAAFGERVQIRPWRPPHPLTYAYLLGVYLGDGHITVRPSGKCWLRIFLDGMYPDLVEEVVDAVALASLGKSVNLYGVEGSRVVIVQCAWKRWPEAFPQHGAGRKHERPIVLESWQREIIEAHPGAFVRGLIHSDGCRTVNRFTTTLPSGRVAEYAYPRYFFSNLSADIRELFREACGLLGVKTTMSNPRNISVAHRKSVAILENIVGPKH